MASSVTLAWDPSTDPSVVSYSIYYGVGSGTYSNTVSVGNVTNATISGLVPGTTYYFAATATSSAGLESEFSNEVVYNNPIPPPPNQPPTLNVPANIAINESSGLQTVNLSGISSGATNEVQTLTVRATSGNTALVPNPTVSYTSPAATGSLSFTPVPGAFGTASVTVTVDDGAASNNIVTRSFTVTVNPVNDPPTLNTLANIAVNESAGLQTVNLSGISSGATNEVQILTVRATSGNTALIPNPTVTYTNPAATGSISFTPLFGAFGTATITVAVDDGGASNNIVTRSFTVTVNPVNDPPTLNALANIAINESAGLQTVNLSGISSGATNETQTLTVRASSGNTALIPNPTVSYTSPAATGSISFTPLFGAFGTATITVTVDDGGASNNIVTRSFTVTVNPVNDPPTLNVLADIAINESAGLQTVNLSGISSGATNEVQTLTVRASSGNTALVPNPTVSYTSPAATGSLSFTPVPGAFGAATVTVTVDDGGASNNIVTRSFMVTVNPVNDPPTLNTVANLLVNENSGLQTVNLSGISSGAINEVQTLTVRANSSNTSLIPNPTVNYASPAATGSLSFTPVPGAFGAATVTVTVDDGGASNNIVTRSFTVTVNQPPTISTITNYVIAVSTQTGLIPFSISDAETPADGLALSASSSNAMLVRDSDIVFGGSSTNRTVKVTPLAGQSGSVDISLTVSDGFATTSTIFQVKVMPKPAPPGTFRIASTP